MPAMNKSADKLGFPRWVLWYITFGVALFVVADGYLFAPLFPIGLFIPFGLETRDTSSDAAALMAASGWLAYVVLTIMTSRARSRGAYFAIYGALCLLLILNVIGCRSVLQGMGDLH